MNRKTIKHHKKWLIKQKSNWNFCRIMEHINNHKGNHECVALVQMAGDAPHTTKWKKGAHIMTSEKGDISKGVVIATFDDQGRYPKSRRHAAFYISHDKSGIWVYDQWNSQRMAKKRKIRNSDKHQRTVDDDQLLLRC